MQRRKCQKMTEKQHGVEAQSDEVSNAGINISFTNFVRYLQTIFKLNTSSKHPN